MLINKIKKLKLKKKVKVLEEISKKMLRDIRLAKIRKIFESK